MKDHEQRELVDDLTNIARKYAGMSQLRQRIAFRIHQSVKNQYENPNAMRLRELGRAETVEAFRASLVEVIQELNAGKLDSHKAVQELTELEHYTSGLLKEFGFKLTPVKKS